MRVVTEQMREQLRKLSQSIYDKMKRCRKLEKSTRKCLADVEEHVEEIYNRIDDLTNDLVRKKLHSTGLTFNTAHSLLWYIKLSFGKFHQFYVTKTK